MNLHDDLCAVLYEHGFAEPTDFLAEFLIKCLEAHLAVPASTAEVEETPLPTLSPTPVNPLADAFKDKFPGFFESAAHKSILDSVHNDPELKKLYLVPPRFGATTLFPVAIASHSLDQGLSTLVISSHVETSKQVELRVSALRKAPTPRGSKFTAPGSNISAASYDIIIVDAYSALDTTQGDEWFASILDTAHPTAEIIVVGFINGRRSLAYRLSQNPEWATHRFPAITWEGKSIDPKRWSDEYLQNIRLTLGEQLFQMNYMQNPPMEPKQWR